MIDQAEWTKHSNWKVAIGTFIVSSAECELWISVLMSDLLPPGVVDAMNDLQIDRKSKIVQAALIEVDMGMTEAQVNHIFKRFAKLASFRNLIAHKPPMIAIYEMGNKDGDQNLRSVVELVSRRDPNKRTTVAEINERIGDVMKVGIDMIEIRRQLLLKKLLLNRN